MTKKPKVAMVGSAGYANHYVDILLHHADPDSFCLEGIVDPFVKRAPLYRELAERKIPMYDTLEQFYQEHTADLVMIATPIKFHKPQSMIALAHGSNVLCEKPLMTNIDEVGELREAVIRSGKQMAVGFQWSFAPSLLEVKRDIISGKFGGPVCFQSLTVFPRYDRYFHRNNWAGKVFDASGSLILDAVATNATAHYLHNIFFMLGDTISASAMPKTIKASLYRANPIETFDSCFMSGEFENGCTFQYLTTHCDVKDVQPVLRYAFENAVLTLDCNEKGAKIRATFKDGSIKEYDSPGKSTAGYDEKIHFMIENVEKNLPIPCQIDTVMPHMTVCDALFDKVEIHDFPKEMVRRVPDPRAEPGSGEAGNFIPGLYEDMVRCMEENKLPDELGLSWAASSTVVDIQNYKHFSGTKFGYSGK